jgi:hypothetical protein
MQQFTITDVADGSSGSTYSVESITYGGAASSYAWVTNVTSLNSWNSDSDTLTVTADPTVLRTMPAGSYTYNFTLQSTDSGTTSTPITVTLTVNPATGYTVSGGSPGSALTVASNNFNVVPNGYYSGTITVSTAAGTATLSATTLNFTGSNWWTPQTFTVTPTAAGQVTLHFVNNGSLTDQANMNYATPPAAPTIGTVTAADASATVAYTAGATGGASVTYTATCSGGPATAGSGVSPITVTGMTNGLTYTSCAVTATNTYGAATSSPSGSVTPATVPAAPTGVTVTPGNAQISVAYTASASSGGANISSYTATCTTGATPTSSTPSLSNPLVVSSLTNGSAYTCTVKATNSMGDSAASTQSSATTPFPAVSYTLTGPTGGLLNNASTNFSVTPNAAYTGTITVGVSGGGLTTTVTKNFSNSATAQTFTITPTAVGPVTLTPTSNPQLGTDPGPLNYNTPPDVPTGITASPGNQQISVGYTAPANNGGSAITGYTATCTTGGTPTSFGPSLTNPLVVTGLTNGSSYTCTVKAANSVTTGAASAASSSVTPSLAATTYTVTGPTGGLLSVASTNFTVTPNGLYTGSITIKPSGGGLATPANNVVLSWTNSQAGQPFTITPTAVGPVTLIYTNSGTLTDFVEAAPYSTPPAAPTIGTATPGNNQISVAYTVPANTGGSAIISYTATCTTGATPTSSAASLLNPLVVSSLTNGSSYTCTVKATNAVGSSVASSASSSVTPAAGVLTAVSNITLTSYVVGTEAALSTTATPVANQDGTAYTASSNKTWLTVTPSGGAGTANTVATGSSTQLTFTVNDALADVLTAGNQVATISLAVTGGATTTFTVTLPVVVPTFTSSLATLPMSAATGSSNPISGTTTLSSSSDGVNFTVTNTGAAWLTVSSLPSGVANTTATGATVITYTVSSAEIVALGAGLHSATVSFYLDHVAAAAATVTVNLTIAPVPSLSASPLTLTFANFVRSGTAPAAVTTQVSDTASESYTIGTTPALPGWLSCVTTSGGNGTGTIVAGTPDTVTCSVVTAQANLLNAGTQTFPVHLQTAGKADVIVTVSLTMTTSISPLTSNPSAITLTYLIGGGATQASMTTTSTVSSIDLQYDNYTVTGAPGWLTVTPTNSRAISGTNDTVTFKGGTTGVTTTSPGSYSAAVKLHIDANNADLTIVVTLNVIGQSMISTPSTVSLTYFKSGGGTLTAHPSISVVNAVNSPFAVDVSTVPVWLAVTLPNPATATPAGATLTLTLVSAVVQGMSTGNYSATIGLINQTGCSTTCTYPGLELTIPISLSISNSSPSLTFKEGAAGSTIAVNYAKGSAYPAPTFTPYSSDEPIPFTASCTLTTSETLAGYVVVPGNGAGASCILSSTSGTAFTLGYPITATLDQSLFNGVFATYGNTVTVAVTVQPQNGASITLTYVYTLRPVAPTITAISPAYVAVPPASPTADLTVTLTGTNFVAPGDIYNGNILETQVWLGASTTALAATQYVVLNDHSHLMITIPLSSLPSITKGTSATLQIALGNQTSSAAPIAGPNTVLTVTQGPVIYAVTSTASFVEPALGANPNVAAYDLISIFGDQFFGLAPLTGPTSATAGVSVTGSIANPLVSNKVPTSLMIGGTTAKQVDLSVTFTSSDKKSTFSAPLLFGNQNQINAIVPSGMTIGNTYNLTVTTGSSTSANYPVNIVTADPGIFTLASDGTGQGAIINWAVPSNLSAAFTVNGSTEPVTTGDTVAIYLTGLGAPDSTGADANSNTGQCVAISNTVSKNGYLQIANAPPAGSGATAPAKAWTNIDGAIIESNLLIGSSLPPCMVETVTVTFGTGPAAVTTDSGQGDGVTWAGWGAGSVTGLFQVNTLVPANAGHGNVPIQVSITYGTGQNAVTYTSPLNGATIYLQ